MPPTLRPPTTTPRAQPLARPHGGPPAPPVWFRGGGDDGSGWPHWQLLAFLLLVLAICGLPGYGLWWAGQRFPYSVVASLAVLACHWAWGHPLQETGPNPPGRMHLAAGLAGAAGFLIGHVAPREASWPILVVASLGLGGAAGYMSWLLGNLLVALGIGAWWLINELRRPRGWNDPA